MRVRRRRLARSFSSTPLSFPELHFILAALWDPYPTLAPQQREDAFRCYATFELIWFFRSTDKYLHLGGPLLAGVTVVALSSLAPMALPLGMRGLAISEAVSLYGDLAVFGGFVLYELSSFGIRLLFVSYQIAFDISTQKILQNARLAEQGILKADPMKESISLQLDMVNIL